MALGVHALQVGHVVAPLGGHFAAFRALHLMSRRLSACGVIRAELLHRLSASRENHDARANRYVRARGDRHAGSDNERCATHDDHQAARLAARRLCGPHGIVTSPKLMAPFQIGRGIGFSPPGAGTHDRAWKASVTASGSRASAARRASWGVAVAAALGPSVRLGPPPSAQAGGGGQRAAHRRASWPCALGEQRRCHPAGGRGERGGAQRQPARQGRRDAPSRCPIGIAFAVSGACTLVA